MNHQSRISRRAASFGAVGTFLFATTTAARQGISPFGEATPVATPEVQGWRVKDAAVLDLDGTPQALSPDGQWLAGVDRDRAFCIWSTSDLEPSVVPFPDPIAIDSIVWAPDSTAVAFSLEAFLHGVDGDIFVYVLADGTIHNLTDDGFDGVFISADAPTSFPIDVMPAWSLDSSAIVFARTTMDDSDSFPTEIVRIPRGGGEVEVLMSIPARPSSIFTPMHVLPDETIVYSVGFSDIDDSINGLWKLEPDGTTSQLFPGAADDVFPMPVITGVWADGSELRVAGLSAVLFNAQDVSRPWLFTWSSSSESPEPISESSDSAQPIAAIWPPDGGTLLMVTRDEQQQAAVETLGLVSELITLPEAPGDPAPSPRWIIPTWSSANTVLVPPMGGAAWLLVMEAVDASA